MVLLANPVATRYAFFFFNDTATTEIYTLSLHDALPICGRAGFQPARGDRDPARERHQAAAHDREPVVLQRLADLQRGPGGHRVSPASAGETGAGEPEAHAAVATGAPRCTRRGPDPGRRSGQDPPHPREPGVERRQQLA